MSDFDDAYDAAMSEIGGDDSNLANEVGIVEASSEETASPSESPSVEETQDGGQGEEIPQSVREKMNNPLYKEAYEDANKELMRNKTADLQIAAQFKGMDPEDAALLSLAYRNAAAGDPRLLGFIVQQLGGIPTEQPIDEPDPLDDYIPITDEEQLLVNKLKQLDEKARTYDVMFQSMQQQQIREHQTRGIETAKATLDKIEQKYSDKLDDQSRLEVCRYARDRGWLNAHTSLESIPHLIEDAYKALHFDKAYQKGIDRSRQVDKTKAAAGAPPSPNVDRTRGKSTATSLDAILDEVIAKAGT